MFGCQGGRAYILFGIYFIPKAVLQTNEILDLIAFIEPAQSLHK